MTHRSRMGPSCRAVVFGVCVAVAGCRDRGGSEGDGAEGGTGDGDESGGSDGSDAGSDDDGEPASCGDAVSPGPTPLRRLTHWEFDNTVRDLFGDNGRYGESFPTETSAIGFDNQASGLAVTSLLAEQYMRAAESIAATAVADLDALLPCDPAAGEDVCAEQWIDALGRRAYRQPLTASQRDRLVAIYSDAKAEHDFATGLELVIQAMLQSPYFLYRVELGLPDPDAEGAEALSDWEIATRLSYMLWGSMPDDELLSAAEAGELGDPDKIAAQAERMLADDRARQSVANFHRQWLRLDDIDTMNKDATLFPELDDQLRASLKSGAQAFLEHAVFDGDGDLNAMLTASYGFVDDETAAIYGVPAPGTSIPTRVDLPQGERAGLLTQPGLLALTAKHNQTSPVQRGVFVQSQLLCTTLPEPPPGVDTTPPEVDPSATTRERFEQHTADPACAGCHELIDPAGFGLENYDPIGRYRTEEGGLSVDASGTLKTLDGDIDFDGAVELAAILADQEQVRQCFVKQWFTYTHGRAPEESDTCSVDTLDASFEAAGQDVATLLVELTRTDAFRYREGN